MQVYGLSNFLDDVLFEYGELPHVYILLLIVALKLHERWVGDHSSCTVLILGFLNLPYGQASFGAWGTTTPSPYTLLPLPKKSV